MSLTAVEILYLNFNFCETKTEDNGDVVKKKTESNETKKDGIQMMTNQWGDLCEQQYKSDFHNGHGDTKKQK